MKVLIEGNAWGSILLRFAVWSKS